MSRARSIRVRGLFEMPTGVTVKEIGPQIHSWITVCDHVSTLVSGKLLDGRRRPRDSFKSWLWQCFFFWEGGTSPGVFVVTNTRIFLTRSLAMLGHACGNKNDRYFWQKIGTSAVYCGDKTGVVVWWDLGTSPPMFLLTKTCILSKSSNPNWVFFCRWT